MRARDPAWRLLAALALLVFAGAVRADEQLPGVELARWVDQVVAPELGETLSRHPRFQGETVRLVTLTPGAVEGESNRLARALERRLRERLLEIDGVRLAVDAPERGCEPPQEVGYLVRIEVAPAGGRSGRVHVAVVDVAESVWVSGISYRWQGRLSAGERTALGTAVQSANPGSAGSPIPLDDARRVAAAMKVDLRCSLPGGLEGAVFMDPPPDAALGRVGVALQSELRYEPLAVMTPERASARWLLTLEAADTTTDPRELNLVLAEANGAARQRVASVFVSGPYAGTAPAPVVSADPVPPATVPLALLSALTVVPAEAEGICNRHRARANTCVEVAFELHRPAYLFVLSTREHVVNELPCRMVDRAEAGPRRFRLRIPPGGYALNPALAGPDAGLYVLAVRERAAAQRLHRALAGAPGHCSGGSSADGAWLARLSRVLAELHDAVEWQAVHLAHGSEGIVRL